MWSLIAYFISRVTTEFRIYYACAILYQVSSKTKMNQYNGYKIAFEQ